MDDKVRGHPLVEQLENHRVLALSVQERALSLQESAEQNSDPQDQHMPIGPYVIHATEYVWVKFTIGQ